MCIRDSLYPASQKEDERHNEAANLVGTCDSRSSIRHPEVFDTLGAQLIKSAPEGGIILMDELGFLENDARAFQSTVMRALDGETPAVSYTHLGSPGRRSRSRTPRREAR